MAVDPYSVGFWFNVWLGLTICSWSFNLTGWTLLLLAWRRGRDPGRIIYLFVVSFVLGVWSGLAGLQLDAARDMAKAVSASAGS